MIIEGCSCNKNLNSIRHIALDLLCLIFNLSTKQYPFQGKREQYLSIHYAIEHFDYVWVIASTPRPGDGKQEKYGIYDA